MNNKIIKNYNACLNCGKIGHEQKNCHNPITSWGIILVKNDNNFKHLNTSIKKYSGIKLFCKNDLFIASENMSKINFLLVRRKHSLGFSEFIRGNYVVENINGIRGLFSQMVPDEIELLKHSSFEELWNYFWRTTEITYKKKFIESKNKFTKLKSKENIEFDLDFYLKTVSTDYQYPEWGFPKGRKKRGETDLECAIREFSEETEIPINKINILNSIKPIEEELVGTNGIKYKHVYFLAETTPDFNISDLQQVSDPEIGDIGFFDYDQCLSLLRDYHVEKKHILQCIVSYYTELQRNKEQKEQNIVDSWIKD